MVIIMSEIYNGVYYVYMHTNKINGKKYVGQTSQKPEKRWNDGKGYKNCSYFYKAIKKYGWDGFYHEIIASNLTKDEADNFENLLIEKLDLLNPDKGYNLKDGGSNGVPSEISRINISNAAKKRCENEEYIKKQRESHKGLFAGDKNPMYGKKHTESAKQKQRDASLGKHPSDDTKNKMSLSHIGEKNVMYGKKHSEETKNKIKKTKEKDKNPKAVKVDQYSLDDQFIKTWDYIKQASEKLDIPYQNISRCCRTGKGTAGGFKWKYTE